METFLPSNTALKPEKPALFLIVYNGRLLKPLDQSLKLFDQIFCEGLQPDILSQHPVGVFGQSDCHVVELKSEREIEGHQWVGLRSQLTVISEALFELCSSALQVLTWHRDHQFCGRCGAPTESHDKDRARVCSRCELHFYPRISPCVITLVTRGDECLLANNARFPVEIYSCLAGFIEPGETAESALRREVKEEVGVDVGHVEYINSQPWPFPGQLMLGFLSNYIGGDIVLEEEEIADAQWFHFDELPMVPPPETISGYLIQEFVRRCRQR